MTKEETICAVPSCDNVLTEEQKKRKIPVCSSCEVAQMHLCESCGKRISTKRIQDGAILCKECEINPAELDEAEMELLEYGSGSFII